MFEKLIGKHRLKKYKWQLAKDHDITLKELYHILTINQANFLNWRYKPLLHGAHRLSMFTSNIASLDRLLTLYVEQLLIEKHINNDLTTLEKDIKLDDWFSDNHNIPTSWVEYYKHLIKVLQIAVEKLDTIPSKKSIFFHRNSSMIRADLKTLIRTIVELDN